MPPRGPFPRRYEILITKHGQERMFGRRVPPELIMETVLTGGEKPLPKAHAPHGGIHVKFTKGSVVVIAEIVGNLCYVITTYYDENRHSRN